MEVTCAECGTELQGVLRCQEYFERMLAWDFSDFAGVGQVHHLMVLCYYLQHPSHYSPEGLTHAIQILKKVIEESFTDRDLYQEESAVFSSTNRTWNVSGTEESHGTYVTKIPWSMTVSAVVKEGISQYPTKVKEWAQTIYTDCQNANLF